MGNVEGSKRNNGFNWNSTAEQVARDISLEGKNVIVTGASAGIGVESARVLAKNGANVFLAVRNVQKGEEAAELIRKKHPESKLHVLQVDLSSLSSVRQFAENFNKLNIPLHVLLCNAGVMACPYEETVDGYESQLGTNHLGHFLLVNLLLPRLEEGAPSRVVCVSSAAHRLSPVNLDDLSGKGTWYTGLWGKWKAYGQSKTANILFAYELNRRMQEKGKKVIGASLHPGGIKTNLQRHLTSFEALLIAASSFLLKTIEQGAATSLYCCTAPEIEQNDLGGKYFSDSNEAVPMEYALNPETAKKLWEISEQMVGLNKE